MCSNEEFKLADLLSKNDIKEKTSRLTEWRNRLGVVGKVDFYLKWLKKFKEIKDAAVYYLFTCLIEQTEVLLRMWHNEVCYLLLTSSDNLQFLECVYPKKRRNKMI